MALLRTSSLRVRLVALFLLIAVPILGVILYDERQKEKELAATVAQTARYAAMTLAAAEDRFLKTTAAILAVVSEIPDILTARACPEIVREVRAKQPRYLNVGIADRRGNAVCSALPLPVDQPINIADRDYFRDAFTHSDFSVGGLQVGRATGKLSFNAGYPIRGDRGEFVGLAFVAMAPALLLGAESSAFLPPGSAVYLVDRKGRILIRDPPPAEADKETIGDPCIEHRISLTLTDAFECAGADGISRYYAVDSFALGRNGLFYAVASIPLKAIIAHGRERFARDLAVIGIIVAAGMGLAWFGAEAWVLRPNRSLLNAIRQLASGDLSARSNVGRGDDELGQLARAFDDMAASLERQAGEVKEHERALKIREEMFRSLFESSPNAIVIANKLGEISMINGQAKNLFGYDPAEIVGSPLETLLPERFRGAHVGFRDAYIAAPRVRPMGALGSELYALAKNGREIPVDIQLGPVETPNGTLVFATVRDVSEIKRQEAQLRQSQKMEAIGQLTGGVAHDFNNLLTIILGNLQLLERSLGDDGPSQKRVDAAIGAVRRGADLTKRLLAFARRQVLDSKVLDMNDVLGGLEDMLRRTLGEDIALKFALAPDVRTVRLDGGELEHALVNLAANARDAMAKGGQLTIETANAVLDEAYAGRHAEVTPGEYAMVAVTDTGCGIPLKLQEKVFEPFFTTKDKGEGTGLGLAMVYGFVKQSGGHAKIYSEPGHGTTVKLYFPRAKAAESPVAEAANANNPVPSGKETILLVEDEAAVREIAVTVLADLGYRVLAAADGPEALELLANNPEVHLLFTDVVMPGGMSGGDLARVAEARFPKLKVLFCSGYAQEGLARSGRVGAGAQLIMKPYDLADLAKKIRVVLDG